MLAIINRCVFLLQNNVVKNGIQPYQLAGPRGAVRVDHAGGHLAAVLPPLHGGAVQVERSLPCA